MIEIKEENYFGKGEFQKCYIHPNNDNLCIKIKTNNNPNNKRVEIELEYFLRIQKKKLKNNSDYSFIVYYHGTQNTNLGEGYIYDLIRDETTNKISKTLFDYLKMENSPISDNIFMAELKKLKKKLIENKIVVRDLTGKNICCRILKDNTIQLIVIDGVGHREFFPFVNWFSLFSRIKTNRVYRKKKLNSINDHRSFYDIPPK